MASPFHWVSLFFKLTHSAYISQQQKARSLSLSSHDDAASVFIAYMHIEAQFYSYFAPWAHWVFLISPSLCQFMVQLCAANERWERESNCPAGMSLSLIAQWGQSTFPSFSSPFHYKFQCDKPLSYDNKPWNAAARAACASCVFIKRLVSVFFSPFDCMSSSFLIPLVAPLHHN